MGFLKDVILGNEKKITDLKLGYLKARIRNENSSFVLLMKARAIKPALRAAANPYAPF